MITRWRQATPTARPLPVLLLVGGLGLFAAAAAAAADEETTVIAAAGPLTLSGEPVRVALSPGGAGAIARLAEVGAGRRLVLILRDLRAAEQPGVLYHVYLDLPPGVEPAADDPRYVGSFNVFNLVAPEGEGGPPDPAAAFRTFDLSDAAPALRGRDLGRDPVTVVIRPGGAPADGPQPVVGRIELVVE